MGENSGDAARSRGRRWFRRYSIAAAAGLGAGGAVSRRWVGGGTTLGLKPWTLEWVGLGRCLVRIGPVAAARGKREGKAGDREGDPVETRARGGEHSSSLRGEQSRSRFARWMFLSHLGSGEEERQVEASTRRGGGRREESIFALGAMTQLMRSYRGASIAG